MFKARIVGGVSLCLIFSASCGDPLDQGRAPRIYTETIQTGDGYPSFDSSGAYFLDLLAVSNPDSLVLAIWNSGITSFAAYAPLSEFCSTPTLRSRFTVQLGKADDRILRLGFQKGSRIVCRAVVKVFLVLY